MVLLVVVVGLGVVVVLLVVVVGLGVVVVLTSVNGMFGFG